MLYLRATLAFNVRKYLRKLAFNEHKKVFLAGEGVPGKPHTNVRLPIWRA